jgi:hypothetical protein
MQVVAVVLHTILVLVSQQVAQVVVVMDEAQQVVYLLEVQQILAEEQEELLDQMQLQQVAQE